jgi:TRAP-type mannitol/chloroaromatic compound transport system permease small subunit
MWRTPARRREGDDDSKLSCGVLPQAGTRQDGSRMTSLLRLADGLRRFLEVIALWSGWLLLIMACVTTFDVLMRKAGAQLPYTKLQELEWHFHAVIFSLWMGYCYTINAHPRVDSFTEGLGMRTKAWIELFGAALLALPYVALVSYFSLDFVYQSFLLGERSDSTVGLTHRWVIKGIYAVGLWLVVLGIVSVLLRVIVFLFSGKPQEEVRLEIGHVEVDV